MDDFSKLEVGFLPVFSEVPALPNKEIFPAKLQDWWRNALRRGPTDPPARGSMVVVRFGMEGLVLDTPGGGHPPFSLLLPPTAYVTSAAMEGEADASVVRLSAAWPIWTLLLKLESPEAAERFGAEVYRVVCRNMAAMHFQSRQALKRGDAEDNPMKTPDDSPWDAHRDGPLVCGAYVFFTFTPNWHAKREDQEDLPEDMRSSVLWLELRAAPGGKRPKGRYIVSDLYYNHRPPALKRMHVTWNDDTPGAYIQLVRNSIIFRPSPSQKRYTREGQPLVFLSFGSEEEARCFFIASQALDDGDKPRMEEAAARLHEHRARRQAELRANPPQPLLCFQAADVNHAANTPCTFTLERRKSRDLRAAEVRAALRGDLAADAGGSPSNRNRTWASSVSSDGDGFEVPADGAAAVDPRLTMASQASASSMCVHPPTNTSVFTSTVDFR